MTNPSQGPIEPIEPQKSNNTKPPYDYKNLFSPSSTRDIVAYILLACGIILMLFQPIYGGLLIGIVTGVYFAPEMIARLRNIEGIIEEEGVARSVILAVLFLALFIALPSVFIGMAIIVAIRLFIKDEPPSQQ